MQASFCPPHTCPAASSLSDADDESEMGGAGDEEEEADSFICEDGYLSGAHFGGGILTWHCWYCYWGCASTGQPMRCVRRAICAGVRSRQSVSCAQNSALRYGRCAIES